MTMKKRKVLWPLVGSMLLGMAALLAGCTAEPATPQGGNAEAANTQASDENTGAVAAPGNEDIVIPLGEVSSVASFYPIEIDGIQLEVLAVEAADGSIRTAFNTCEVCYDSGRGYYVQEGDVLVCQNCGNRFATSQIEVQSNGCNPWPIFPQDKTVDDESITISHEFLQQAVSIFKNWKGNY